MLITHRGAGSFIEEDFSKKPLYMCSDAPRPEVVNQSQDKLKDGEQRSEIVEQSLVKPSISRETFEGAWNI